MSYFSFIYFLLNHYIGCEAIITSFVCCKYIDAITLGLFQSLLSSRPVFGTIYSYPQEEHMGSCLSSIRIKLRQSYLEFEHG